MSSSCCGGNCGCGTGCKCGSSCSGCKMYPDMSSSERSTTEILVLGVAPNKSGFEGAETGRGGGGENGGCKCNPCTCQPCTCK